MTLDTQSLFSSSLSVIGDFNNQPYSDIGIDMWQLLPFSRGNVTITVRVLLCPF